MDAAMPMHEQAGRNFAGTAELRPGSLDACPSIGLDPASGVLARLARRRRG
jgi:hypothetical protein